MKVEVASLGSSSLIVHTVTVDMINIELVVFQLYTIGSEVFFPASLITVPMIS